MPGRREKKERQLKKKQQQRLNVIVLITGAAFILAAILMIPWIKQSLGNPTDFVKPDLNHRPMQNGNTMGDPSAQVVLEEYSDFTCAHCRTFALITTDKIVKDYVAKGQVFFVFNSVGSILGHPNAPVAAEAAYCAGDQNLFWEYHDLLYENQTILFSNINRKLDKSLISLAEFLELDPDRFQSCLDQGKFSDKVREDQIEAFQAGIIETPSILINGELFEGNWLEGELVNAIEAALENSNQ